jgi:hypothetical protein
VTVELGSVAKTVARVSLSRAEAAECLGVSLRHFEEYVQPHVRLVYLGRRQLVPVAELERFVAANARRPVAEERR